MNTEEIGSKFQITPVGSVRSKNRNVSLGLRRGDLEIFPVPGVRRNSRHMISEVLVREEYSECLEGIEEFSHIIILYWSHLTGKEGRKVRKVHPGGQKDMPLVGVFATRSPARPNPVCATTAELIERKGNILIVRGLDAVDGSPIIDIKPHHPYFDAPGEVRLAGWMDRLMKRFADLRNERSQDRHNHGQIIN